MDNKFRVSVALAVLCRNDNRAYPNKCAFYDTDDLIFLPNAPITYEKYANQVIVSLVKTIVPVNPMMINITSLGFFDPIQEEDSEEERKNREIVLAYNVLVSPGMPILNKLEFKTYEELKLSIGRVNKTHLRIFRAGMFL